MTLEARTDVFNELATGYVEADSKDESGVALGSGDIIHILMTLYDVASGGVINNRLLQDVKNANDVTIDASGNLAYTVQPADNIIVDSAIAVGSTEDHVAHLVWCWGTGITTGTLSNAIATTNTDQTVTVTHASHGLVDGDCVFFKGAAEVGGLNINGVRIITKIDANSYSFEHPNAATASESSGGGSTINYALNPEVGRDNIEIQVLQMKKAPGG